LALVTLPKGRKIASPLDEIQTTTSTEEIQANETVDDDSSESSTWNDVQEV